MFKQVILAIMISGTVNASAAFDCGSKATFKTNQLARDFMILNQLIRTGEEKSLPEIGVVVRWKLFKVEPIADKPNACVVVMSLCVEAGGNSECGHAYELMGLISAQNKGDQILSLEKIIHFPSRVLAKIGFAPGHGLPPCGEPSFYYAELTGSSAVEASKAFMSQISYHGFRGVAVLGKKLSSDPTPNRNWKIENATYSLRRGETAEVLDIQAYQFDGLDGTDGKNCWDGCMQPENKHGKCEVAPWGQSSIRELKILN